MKNTTILMIAIAFTPLLAACQRAAVQGGDLDSEVLYFQEVKGRIATVEYVDADRRSRHFCLPKTRNLLSTLAHSGDEDVRGYEDKFARMTALATELEQLYLQYANTDETTPKVAELVSIAASLPGGEVAYSAYW